MMTFDQLRIFIAVAEREHLTRAAGALHLTPSAVSAAVQTLEQRYGVPLFHRVGRRIELSADGRAFLPDARAALAGVSAAEHALQELGGLQRGTLHLAASQTLVSYWLPSALAAFVAAHPAIGREVDEGNTTTVAAAVKRGDCELGFIEGEIDEPALAVSALDDDRLVVVADPKHPLAGRKVTLDDLASMPWVMREADSGTRAVFEQALVAAGCAVDRLRVVLQLPTNEAVCLAVRGGECLTVVSDLVARRHVEAGRLRRIGCDLPLRRFAMLRHKERYRSKAALAFESVLRQMVETERALRATATYDI